MEINGLDGRIYRWNAAACQAITEKRSSLHLKATDLPTGDPEIVGVIYKTVDGTLKVSAG